MKRIAFIYLLLVACYCTNAQNYIDLAKFRYTVSPSNQFDSSSVNNTLYEMNADFTLPIVINDNLALITGLSYDNASTAIHPDRDRVLLSVATLKLGASVTHNDKWSGTYMVLPQLSSDFKKISNKDIILGGLALWKYKKSNHLNYQFGVYANGEFFSPFVVPLFAVYYLSPNEKFEAKIVMPLTADINYALTDQLKWGVSFKGTIKSFNINTPFKNESERYLTQSSKDFFTYLQYGMSNGIHLKLEVGRSVGRSYAIYDQSVDFAMPLVYFNDNREQLNSNFANGWLFRVGAFYRLDLTKKKEKS